MPSLLFSRKIAYLAIFLSLALILTGCFKKNAPVQPIQIDQQTDSGIQTDGLSTSEEAEGINDDLTISSTEDGLDDGLGNTKIKSQGDLDSLLNNLNSEADDSRIRDVNDSDIDQF